MLKAVSMGQEHCGKKDVAPPNAGIHFASMQQDELILAMSNAMATLQAASSAPSARMAVQLSWGPVGAALV